MSEKAPQAPMGPSEQNRQKLEAKANSNESEWKMLGFAKQAAEAKKNNKDDDYNVATAAIQARLGEAVASGELTEEGARNRAEQIDKIIDNLVGDGKVSGGPVKTAERVSVRTGSEKDPRTAKPVTTEETPANPAEEVAAEDSESTPETEDNKSERKGSGTEDDPYVNGSPEDLPTPEDLEENAGKLNWRQRARKSLGLKANYAKHLVMTGGHFGAARQRFQAETGLTDEDMAEQRKKNGRLAIVGALAATGVAAAIKGPDLAQYVADAINGDTGGGNFDPSQPDADFDTDIGGDNLEIDNLHETYSQGHDVNPFYDDDKLGVHNYGGPLEAGESDVRGVAGSGEMLENWRHNSGQMSVAAAEMGLPEFSAADTDPSRFGLEGADNMADTLNGDLEKYDDTYKQLVDILENETTTAEKITLEPGTYGSYYQVDVNGDLVNAYDPSVNELATGTKYTYQLEDGSWHQVIFKDECGGQVVHLNETSATPQVAVAPEQSTPEQPYTAPAPAYTPEAVTPVYGGGSPEVPSTPSNPGTPETPDSPDTPETPVPETQPPVTQPPETQPPVTNPPETQPPVETLPPKDINENDVGIWDAPLAETGTNEFNQLGDPIQNNTDPVVNQAPGSFIAPEQTGGQASGAEVVTPVEQQQQATTPEAVGAPEVDNPGVSGGGGYFGESTSADTEPAPVNDVSTGGEAPAAAVDESASSGPATQ